jgi:hypothetical protein
LAFVGFVSTIVLHHEQLLIIIQRIKNVPPFISYSKFVKPVGVGFVSDISQENNFSNAQKQIQRG